MRVELALIVGIVCFCCWCAYILINMNSTVAIPPQLPPRLQQQQQSHASPTSGGGGGGGGTFNREVTSPSQRLVHQYAMTTNPNDEQRAMPIAPATQLDGTRVGPTSTLLHDPHVGPPLQLPATRFPQLNTPAHYQRTFGQGQLTSSYYSPSSPPSPPTTRQPSSFQGHPASYRRGWPSYPSSTTTRNPLTSSSSLAGRQAEPVAEAQVSSGSLYYPSNFNRWPSNGGAAATTSYRQPSRRMKVYDDSEDLEEEEPPSAASDQQDQAEPEVAQESEEQQDPNQQPRDSEALEKDEEEEEELPARETRQSVGARSFSEQQSEANERDRTGRPIRLHHRHLINGRPAPETAQTVADFEAVVNELDPDPDQPEDAAAAAEDEQQQDYDEEPQRGSPQRVSSSSLAGDESRPRSARAQNPLLTHKKGPIREPLKRRRSESLMANSRRRPKRAERAARQSLLGRRKPQRESHQHRLSESLSAQQWDDDAASSPSTTSSSNQRSSILEPTTTTEAPLTEEEAMGDEEAPDEGDMFAGTDRFPFLESDSSDSKRRRKRQVSAEMKPTSFVSFSIRKSILKSHLRSKLPPVATNQRLRVRRSTAAAADNDNDDWHLAARANEIDDEQQDSLKSRRRNVAAGNGERDMAYAHDPLPEVSADDFAIEHYSSPQASDKFLVHKDDDRADSLNGLGDLNIRIVADPRHDSLVSPASPDSNSWPPPSSDATSYPASPTTQRPPTPPPPPPMRPPYEELRYDDGPIEPSGIQHQNGHSGGPILPEYYGPSTEFPEPQYPSKEIFNSMYGMANEYGRSKAPLASSHKLKRKKFKRSKMSEEKYQGSKAHKSKKSSKHKKAGLKKAKKKAKRKSSKRSKQFKGSTKGKKAKKGHGEKGAKKGALYYKDKGYKKRGFKKAYKKVEAGDHKTYFDEFRDKDHNKKWKDFKDKHHYSQSKKWAGKDMKKYKDYDAHEMKHKKHGIKGLKEKSSSKYKHDYKYKNGSSKKKKKKKKKME